MDNYLKLITLQLNHMHIKPITGHMAIRLLPLVAATLLMGHSSLALGTASIAKGNYSTALGTGSWLLVIPQSPWGMNPMYANKSVGVGNNVQAINDGSMVYGLESYAGGIGSIAIGKKAMANIQMSPKFKQKTHEDMEMTDALIRRSK